MVDRVVSSRVRSPDLQVLLMRDPTPLEVFQMDRCEVEADRLESEGVDLSIMAALLLSKIGLEPTRYGPRVDRHGVRLSLTSTAAEAEVVEVVGFMLGRFISDREER